MYQTETFCETEWCHQSQVLMPQVGPACRLIVLTCQNIQLYCLLWRSSCFYQRLMIVWHSLISYSQFYMWCCFHIRTRHPLADSTCTDHSLMIDAVRRTNRGRLLVTTATRLHYSKGLQQLLVFHNTWRIGMTSPKLSWLAESSVRLTLIPGITSLKITWYVHYGICFINRPPQAPARGFQASPLEQAGHLCWSGPRDTPQQCAPP